MSGDWIGVDLDGTLAQYNGWIGIHDIGDPVPLMLERVKKWISEGRVVKIFTARVYNDPNGEARQAIDNWCKLHVGVVLPVTCMKDYGMIELWDDRAIRVQMNTGVPCLP